MDTVAKRKIPSPCQESNPRIPIVQPIAQHYTELSWYHAMKIYGGVEIQLHNSYIWH
jgi:hypothetical protein